MIIKSINKKGITMVTMPIILTLSIVILIIITYFLLNNLTPFIWYEKINQISNKYLFVIEKYGYLTLKEKEQLLQELKSQGFDTEKIKISAPTTKKAYGEIIEFKIEYNLGQNTIGVENGNIKLLKRNINMVVKKSSYIKR